ncbi:MAG: phosphate acyltransferase PlsX [Deltaproteobacteria bacterium]|nr:phosphate acyltransferase PlsX [Deltaproteobacteria bacterium]
MNNSQLPAVTLSAPVALDAMGGDFGVEVCVEGAVLAAKEMSIASILVGDESKIRAALKNFKAENNPLLTVFHASEEIQMEESPSVAIRRKADSSIRRAFELAKQGKASGVVSAGNTGAVMAGGLLVLGTLPGIARPAIASLIPKVGDGTPTVLLDAGANIDCHAYQLVQFALMGSHYAESALGCTRPRVGLLSNGSEASKGTDITRSAYVSLSEIKAINFIGYVEGNDISQNVADVVVCDGFEGNIVLKSIEGAVELVFDTIQRYVQKTGRGKLGFWIAKPILKKVFHERLDPSAYGGAPLLGLNGNAIVCHGGSNSRSIMNGIRIAHKFAQEGLLSRIASALTDVELQVPGAYEDGMWGRMGQRFTKQKKDKKKQAEASSSK